MSEALDCGCIIRCVAPGSFVFGLCALHEEYPDWQDADDHAEVYERLEAAFTSAPIIPAGHDGDDR